MLFDSVNQKELTHSLWVEKYRPSTVDAYIGNDILKQTILKYINKKDIPNLLLFGPAGTGKTSLAKLLTKLIPCDSMYINASDENGIETVRTKIKNFASSMGFNPLKVIILDECLDENTVVTTLRDGKVIHVPIKELKDETDLVKSFNIKKERIEWRPFILLDKGMSDVYEIEFENGQTIICTDSHKWYVKDDEGNIVKMKLIDIINKNITNILTF